MHYLDTEIAASLDFFFRSECTCCGYPTGWNGETKVCETYGAGIKETCTNCRQSGWTHGGELHEMFRTSGPPVFQPGRRKRPDVLSPDLFVGPTMDPPGEQDRTRWLYNLAILTGLGLIVFIYGFAFDNLSENQLVQATLYWYTPLIFGIYGRTAVQLRHLLPQGLSLQRTLHQISFVFRISPLFNLVFFFPFFFFSSDKPIKIALMGSALWLGMLGLFFYGIWPSL